MSDPVTPRILNNFQHRSLKRGFNKQAFTLFELMVAVGIASIMVGAFAYVSYSSFVDNRLKEPSTQFENMAQKALEQSILTGNYYSIKFIDKGFELYQKDQSQVGEDRLIARYVDSINALNMWVKATEESIWTRAGEYEWHFNPIGLVEPISIRFENENDDLTQEYSPVTASAIVSY